MEESEEVRARLHVQACHHPDMPAAIICIEQTKFNERFQKLFMRPLPVCWPYFAPPARNPTMVHFRSNAMSMPGGFKQHKKNPQMRQHNQSHPPQTSVPPPVRITGARILQLQEISRSGFQTAPRNEDCGWSLRRSSPDNG